MYIDWLECLKYPLEYLTKKAHLFTFPNASETDQLNPKNKLYVKIRWIPKADYKKFGNFLETSEEKLKKGL